jgi:hypothetical protein
MTVDTSLIAFKSISSFINDLSDVFGDDQHNLKLYAHLISKTTLTHDVVIKKHIGVFRNFCIVNRRSIEEKDVLVLARIEYSEKVFIDMGLIFDKADKSTTRVIWKHLLVISAILDTAGQARRILKEAVDSGGEADFLTNIIEKIEDVVDPDADPMEAISSIMSSGVFTDLIGGMGSGIQDGSLNIEKLMGSVQKMVSKMDGGSDIDISGMMDLMKNQTGGDTDGAPDMSKLLGPMMNMISPKGGTDGAAPDMSAMMASLMGGGKDGAAPDMSAMMASLMGGGKDGAAPDMSAMMASLMGGGTDGAAPDMSAMMASLMGGGKDGAAPDMSAVMASLMGGGKDGAAPDMSAMMASLMGGGKDGAAPDMMSGGDVSRPKISDKPHND